MALLLPSSSSSLSIKKPNLLVPTPPHHLIYQTKSKNVCIKCQDPSSSSNSSGPTESTTTSSTVAPPSDQTSSTTAAAGGLGFGSTNAARSQVVSSKKKQKGKKERASIIRRAPLAKPSFASQKEDIQAKERSPNESAFLLAWIGFGAIIIFEGILLAASGFLPEEWDNFFVKYLYPSFTPTVFLFVAGSVAYGVLKYLENEKPKSDG